MRSKHPKLEAIVGTADRNLADGFVTRVIKDKLVKGDNILQTAQFVQSGNADVGLIALSLALAPPMKSAGRYFEVPPSDYPPIIQAAVILKSARDKDTSEKFLKFLKEPSSVALMKQYGFVPPGAAD